MSPNTVLYILIFGAVGGIVAIVLYGGEAGWGPGLTIGLSFGAFVLAAIAYAIYESARKRRRRAEAPQAAAALGLVPEAAGGSPLPAMPPFHLLSQGMRRKAENVMSGEAGDGRVWLFDYTYYTESTSYNSSTGSTSTHRHDHYFSCALAELRGTLPAVSIGHEGFFSRIARGLGFEDVEVGAREFDRRFKVKASAPDVARELLDPSVQHWLLSLEEEVSFEISDRWLLAYTKQRELSELRPILDAAVGFRDALRSGLVERFGEPRS